MKLQQRKFIASRKVLKLVSFRKKAHFRILYFCNNECKRSPPQKNLLRYYHNFCNFHLGRRFRTAMLLLVVLDKSILELLKQILKKVDFAAF